MKHVGNLKHPLEHSDYIFCNTECEKKDVCKRHISHYDFEKEMVRAYSNLDVDNCSHLMFDAEYEILEVEND